MKVVPNKRTANETVKNLRSVDIKASLRLIHSQVSSCLQAIRAGWESSGRIFFFVEGGRKTPRKSIVEIAIERLFLQEFLDFFLSLFQFVLLLLVLF